MNTPRWLSLLMAAVLLAGCAEGDTNLTDSGDDDLTLDVTDGVAVVEGEAASSGSGSSTSAAGEIHQISPENTSIAFVGSKPTGETHEGGFTQFTGQFSVAGGKLASLQIDIETDSLWADNGRLTGHLKTADFFSVQEYPQATFQSTSISAGGATNEFNVTGDLTLHGQTAEISFPVNLEDGEHGPALRGEFEIDRTEFGMDYQTDNIHKEVKITVGAGGAQPAAGQGAARGGRGGGWGDPAAMFSDRDADGDGKLMGDEIHERMRDRLAEVDTDGDGAVSQEEFMAMMQAMRERFGGGGGGGRPGRPGDQ